MVLHFNQKKPLLTYSYPDDAWQDDQARLGKCSVVLARRVRNAQPLYQRTGKAREGNQSPGSELKAINMAKDPFPTDTTRFMLSIEGFAFILF